MEAAAQQIIDLDHARAALQSGSDVSEPVRKLAHSFGITRPEAGTLCAITAALDKLENPEKYARDRDAWEAHGAKERNYRQWKRKLTSLTNAEIEEAADLALAAVTEDVEELVAEAAEAFSERREATLETSGTLPAREKQYGQTFEMHHVRDALEGVVSESKVDPVDELKLAGNELYAAGKYVKAKDMYSRAIDKCPQAALFTNRAACYLQEGKWRKAIADCDKALAIDPCWPRAFERKAQALMEIRKYKEVISICEQGLNHASKKQVLQTLLGTAKHKVFIEQQPTTYESRGGAAEIEHLKSGIKARFERGPVRKPTLGEMKATEAFVAAEQRTTRKALELECKGRVDEAVLLYEEGAANGSTTAMCALSRIFVHGQGVPVDQERGAGWAKRCIANGPDPAHKRMDLQTDAALHSAYGMLGQCFRHGWGVEMNLIKASELLSVAAEAGDTTSMNNLGSLKYQLASNEEEEKEAVAWYRKAAEAAYPLGMVNLGFALMDGFGCEVNYAEAEQWLNKAAAFGDASARLGLAKLKNMQGASGEAVADEVKRSIELQLEQGGEVTHTAALNAFQLLIEEQKHIDNDTTTEFLSEQLLDLDIIPPAFSFDHTKPLDQQLEMHRQELLSTLLLNRPLTKIEEQAVEHVMETPSGFSARLLGNFLIYRGQRARGLKAFEVGARFEDAISAYQLGELLLEDGDTPQAVKYLRQASSAGVREANDSLAGLKAKMNAPDCDQDVRSSTPQTTTAASAIDDIADLLKTEVSASTDDVQKLTKFFRQLASPTSPNPSSARLLGDSPFDRAVIMQQFVKENPDSLTGNSLLFASKFHMAAELELREGNADAAIDVR